MLKSRFTGWTVPVIVIAALAAAGCGSSSSSKTSTTTTKAQAPPPTPSTPSTPTTSTANSAFSAKLDDACSTYILPAIQAINSKDFKGAGEDFGKFVKVLNNLTPPAGLKSNFDQLTAVVNKFAIQLEQGNASGGDQFDTKAKALSQKLGAPVCAQHL